MHWHLGRNEKSRQLYVALLEIGGPNTAGTVAFTAFNSPFRRDRKMARNVTGAANLSEVFVDSPVAMCERRDPKVLPV